MSPWNNTLVSPSATVTEAIRIIDTTAKQICLVVDNDRKLLGTVTDGDVRRFILRTVPLDAPVTQAMNAAPITASQGDSRDKLLAQMRIHKIHQLPIIDHEGRVVGLAVLDDLLDTERPTENWVVLMAGGLGTRLRPLTENTPKPLLQVGHKPLLELTIERLVRQDFRRFYVSVNYRAEMIKAHLGDGSRWGAEIYYLDETKRLGTAGALSLIPELPSEPLLVMNADLLTKVDLRQLLAYHREYSAVATMAVRDYEFEVPYGVVRVDDTDSNSIVSIDEKPVHHFFVNAGIYVINPEVISSIPKNQFIDMPNIFCRLKEENKQTSAFPLREYWLDIGRIDDFIQANREFLEEFTD